MQRSAMVPSPHPHRTTRKTGLPRGERRGTLQTPNAALAADFRDCGELDSTLKTSQNSTRNAQVRGSNPLAGSSQTAFSL